MYQHFKEKYRDKQPDEIIEMDLDYPASVNSKDRGKLIIKVFYVPIEEYDVEPLLKIKVSRGGYERPETKIMTVESTAYSHTGNRTYTGTWPKEGRTIAVDPQAIPIGSKVYIKELGGWYVAEDKIPPESVAKGARVDIFMDDENRCWEWGRRDITVKAISAEPQ